MTVNIANTTTTGEYNFLSFSIYAHAHLLRLCTVVQDLKRLYNCNRAGSDAPPVCWHPLLQLDMLGTVRYFDSGKGPVHKARVRTSIRIVSQAGHHCPDDNTLFIQCSG